MAFIKLDRKFFDNFLWKEDRTYSLAEAWIDLIQSARFEVAPIKVMVKMKTITINRGELRASQRYLSNRWNWSVGRVNRFLKILENEQMIKRRREHSETIITLCKYDNYNNQMNTNGTAIDTDTEQQRNTDGTLIDTNNKKEKKDKNLKKEKDVVVKRTDTPVPIFKSEKYFSVDFLKKEILKNKKICELIFQNKKNEIGNLEKLKLRLDDFQEQLSDNLIYEKQGNDFCKHFLSWNKKNLELNRGKTTNNSFLNTGKVKLNALNPNRK